MNVLTGVLIYLFILIVGTTLTGVAALAFLHWLFFEVMF